MILKSVNRYFDINHVESRIIVTSIVWEVTVSIADSDLAIMMFSPI